MRAVKNAPVPGLQPVADIGERSLYDHAYGVIEMRAPHLAFDIDREQVPVTAIACAGQRKLPSRRRDSEGLFLVCQSGYFRMG